MAVVFVPSSDLSFLFFSFPFLSLFRALFAPDVCYAFMMIPVFLPLSSPSLFALTLYICMYFSLTLNVLPSGGENRGKRKVPTSMLACFCGGNGKIIEPSSSRYYLLSLSISLSFLE
jgi:hypothetical protein